MAAPPVRVVSLVPSATETLAAWGLDPIACTRFCERPDLPHVGGTKNPDVEAIVALAPDVVVVDRQENRREDAEAIGGAGIDLVVLDVRSVEGLPTEMSKLADAVGVEPTRLHPPDLHPGDLELERPASPSGRRVFVPIWRRPWMTIGGRTYGSSVLEAAGLANVYADAADDYPQIDLTAVAERRPDLVLVPSEPYSFRDEHLEELREIAPAIRVDGQDLFWWGVRTPGAIGRLRGQLDRR